MYVPHVATCMSKSMVSFIMTVCMYLYIHVHYMELLQMIMHSNPVISGVHKKTTFRIVAYYIAACSTARNFCQEKKSSILRPALVDENIIYKFLRCVNVYKEDKATSTALGKFNPLNIIFPQYKVAGLGEIFVQ